MTIGTKLSTTFNPVSKDLLTEERTIIEGARVSIKLRDSAKIGPLSSKGILKDLQHAPIKPYLLERSSIHIFLLHNVRFNVYIFTQHYSTNSFFLKI
jgi:hypothetical protein